MYTGLLHLHSSLRYVVLILLVIAIIKALVGWLGTKPFTAADNKIGTALLGTAHLQVVIGLLLLFLGPIFDSEVPNPELQRWAMEHVSLMIIAAILITVGRVLSKKAAVDLKKHQRSAIFYSIAFAAIMRAIPWDRDIFVKMLQ